MWSFSGPYFPVFGLNNVDLLRESPYSVQMRENTDQKNSVFGQFLRSGCLENQAFLEALEYKEHK